VKILRILLVEDKWRVAGRLKVQLERLGHEVVGLASDGPEAVSCAWRLEPDLVIMESQLHIIDGIETAQTILTHKPIPIILLTAYAAADFVQRAREVGVMAYLVTHGEPPPLGPTIKVALARFEELEAIRQEVGNLKDALKTRTLVEQAKRILMRRQKLSEAQAFRNMQRQSRRIGTSLGESASMILRVEELLFKDVNVVRTLQSTLSAIHRGLRSTARRPQRDAL
jgi:AmiR/NasT family two-component response regulator